MGALAIPIAVAVSAASAGYGIYAGERARSDAARQYRTARDEAREQRNREAAQLEADKAEMRALEERQRAEQTATEERLRREQGEALTRVRGEVPGMQAKLGEDLLAQQQKAYSRMTPQMEARLNALGLLQSGALPEAQAKYQGDLEAQRQVALADFGMSASRELNIDRPLAYSSEDVGRQYEGMRRNLETAGTNLSQQFANQNIFNQNEAAREQYLAGLATSRNAAAQDSANAYMNFAGQIGGRVIGASGARGYGSKGSDPSMAALNKVRGGWSNEGRTRYGGYA